jgi:hypothetical protein
MAEAIYTHVGCHAYTGHYAVTADAYRKPGKVHALSLDRATSDNPYAAYKALCGETIRMRSDDHFLQDEPQIVPAAPGHRITCKRCKTAIAKAEKGGDPRPTLQQIADRIASDPGHLDGMIAACEEDDRLAAERGAL